MVEQWFPKPEVKGSTPFSPAKHLQSHLYLQGLVYCLFLSLTIDQVTDTYFYSIEDFVKSFLRAEKGIWTLNLCHGKTMLYPWAISAIEHHQKNFNILT